MDERRQLPRWEIKKEVKVWIPLTQGFSHCMVEDMHLKGMRVSFNKRLPHQKIIRMSFALGEEYDFIKVEARIAWMKEDQDRFVYGLSFNSISDYDKDKIGQYIQINCCDQFRDKWWGK
jgi:hypothetical protein